jgi:hypothetical protein
MKKLLLLVALSALCNQVNMYAHPHTTQATRSLSLCERFIELFTGSARRMHRAAVISPLHTTAAPGERAASESPLSRTHSHIALIEGQPTQPTTESPLANIHSLHNSPVTLPDDSPTHMLTRFQRLDSDQSERVVTIHPIAIVRFIPFGQGNQIELTPADTGRIHRILTGEGRNTFTADTDPAQLHSVDEK